MSMASKRRARLPTPEALWMVGQELGFTGAAPLEGCQVWLEDIGGGDQAVNVVQPVALTAAGKA